MLNRKIVRDLKKIKRGRNLPRILRFYTKEQMQEKIARFGGRDKFIIAHLNGILTTIEMEIRTGNIVAANPPKEEPAMYDCLDDLRQEIIEAFKFQSNR